MNTIYLLSGPLKNTGFPSKIKKLLKNDLKNKKSIAFIPTTPNDYKKNDLYVYGDNKNILGLNSYLKEISSLENMYPLLLTRNVRPCRQLLENLTVTI